MTGVGVVITTCAGREENLRRVLACIAALQPARPDCVVIVYDGCELTTDLPDLGDCEQIETKIEKHEPGREQPRNIGLRVLSDNHPELGLVWFLDSDLIFEPDCLAQFTAASQFASEDRILIGPYDWLAPGETSPRHDLKNDPRWVSFDANGPDVTFVNDIGAGLGNFAGNLMWPIDAFKRIGGFHIDLHHGRCEDGELGLRAAFYGVPMALVGAARAWHVDHAPDTPAILAKNERDVPILNALHPWVQEFGLIPVEKDGIRFDWICPDCGEQVNSLHYWIHSAGHRDA